MGEFALPILGFDDREPPMRVQWKDGTRLTYCGILAPRFRSVVGLVERMK